MVTSVNPLIGETGTPVEETDVAELDVALAHGTSDG
jgi:hypothetical protein